MTDVPEGHEPAETPTLEAPPASPPLARPPEPAVRKPLSPAWLLAACVVVLAVAGYLVWQSSNAAGDLAAREDALEQRVASLDPRLAAIEGRPLPQPPPDLRPLQQKLAELDQKLTALDGREAAFEQKPPPPVPLDPPARAEIAALSGRIDQLVARLNQIGESTQADTAKVQGQIAQQDQKVQGQFSQQDQRLAAAVKNSAQIDQLTAREARLTLLQGAGTALAAGRPLGEIPGAPPALAQFAAKPPPTEAALRLSYGDAAEAAREAGLPPKQDGAFLDRVWARAQSSIVVRQGDRVLVGDAITGVLAHAQSQVDAGDLAGALHTLDQLAGPAAAAMAGWRQQAQSLVDARAALLTMAHN